VVSEAVDTTAGYGGEGIVRGEEPVRQVVRSTPPDSPAMSSYAR